MKISLRPGERLYLNGAVLRSPRKATVELLNDAVFLLEQHIMQPDEATTPLRQLYFVVQLMMIEPGPQPDTRGFSLSCRRVARMSDDATMDLALATVADLVERARFFDALRILRRLYRAEEADGRRAAPCCKTEGEDPSWKLQLLAV